LAMTSQMDATVTRSIAAMAMDKYLPLFFISTYLHGSMGRQSIFQTFGCC
jgi:hypothetical protein